MKVTSWSFVFLEKLTVAQLLYNRHWTLSYARCSHFTPTYPHIYTLFLEDPF